MAVESVGVLLPYIQQQFGYNFWKTSLPGIFFFLYDKMGRKNEIEVMAGKLGGGRQKPCPTLTTWKVESENRTNNQNSSNHAKNIGNISLWDSLFFPCVRYHLTVLTPIPRCCRSSPAWGALTRARGTSIWWTQLNFQKPLRGLPDGSLLDGGGEHCCSRGICTLPYLFRL